MKFVRIVRVLASLGMISPVHAADPFYVGSWKITAAVVAPWADAERKPDAAVEAGLNNYVYALKKQ
jgi:hypothetical protein